jgi:acyl carrier protein
VIIDIFADCSKFTFNKMDNNVILDGLTRIFRDITENGDLVLTRDLTADDVEGWDSLNHTLIITEIQKQFNIKFTLPEVLKLENIGDLLDTIKGKLS